MIRCKCGRECRHICPDCKNELGAGNGNTLHSLVGLLRRVHDEIDAIDEGIPMSADTWDEMEDVLQANTD